MVCGSVSLKDIHAVLIFGNFDFSSPSCQNGRSKKAKKKKNHTSDPAFDTNKRAFKQSVTDPSLVQCLHTYKEL